ncbi:octopamine receptor 2-like [Patiria miniata]|uniref:G-protein coupled receptors family 1 profile domain-containing protein n=1 Tax=Patiria miniata TaxID=46514 RepID=A0A913ZWQ7_PATMI|nr:octopamine receptor 2-like [Patiria miniata]
MGDSKHEGTGPPTPLQNNSGSAELEWTPQTILAMVSVSLLTILTIFGNVLVIIAVVKYKRLQIPSNYILVNLAVADVSVAVFAPLVFVVELLGYLVTNVYLCILPYCLVTLGCGVSLLSLGIVAYDRYAALVKPLKYYQHVTMRRVLCFSLVIWMFVFIIAFMPLCWQFLVESQTDDQPACSFYLLSKYLLLFQVLVIFVPAFLVMIGCYCRVMLVARHHSRAISAIQLSLFPNTFSKNLHMFKGTKYTRTLLIILGFFFLTWVTFTLMLLIERFCDICSRTIPLHHYSVFLIFANSALNPWIYAHRNQDFKSAFRRLFRCGKKSQRSSARGPEGRRNSRVSDALSRTNSMVGGLQHLHVLYNNADIVPPAVDAETGQLDSKTSFRAAPKLIQHNISKPVVETVAEEVSGNV